MNGLFGIAA